MFSSSAAWPASNYDFRLICDIKSLFNNEDRSCIWKLAHRCSLFFWRLDAFNLSPFTKTAP